MAWELFRRDEGVGPEMIGIDGELLDGAPVPGLPLACEVTIDAPSTRPEFLAPAESALERLTAHVDGRIAATGRTSTRLVTLVYLADDEHASRYTEVPLPAKASVTVAPANDPDWTLFDRFRPRDMEAQSMDDLRVMADLHAAGDLGGVREIEHTVRDVTPDRADAFATAVTSLGFTSEAAGDATVVVRNRADPADLTSDSWTLRLVAERHGARYDGWRCDVVVADDVSPSRTRKWFGRR